MVVAAEAVGITSWTRIFQLSQCALKVLDIARDIEGRCGLNVRLIHWKIGISCGKTRKGKNMRHEKYSLEN
jgi:hypothetical protein